MGSGSRLAKDEGGGETLLLPVLTRKVALLLHDSDRSRVSICGEDSPPPWQNPLMRGALMMRQEWWQNREARTFVRGRFRCQFPSLWALVATCFGQGDCPHT